MEPKPKFCLKWYHVILLQPIVAIEAEEIIWLITPFHSLHGEGWKDLMIYLNLLVSSSVASAIICPLLFRVLKSVESRLIFLLIIMPILALIIGFAMTLIYYRFFHPMIVCH